MNDFLETFIAAALSNALVATLLAAAALIASRWAKPTVAHALWLLVLIKLVTPPLFEAGVPVPTIVAAREVPRQTETKKPIDSVADERETTEVAASNTASAVPIGDTALLESNELPPVSTVSPFIEETVEKTVAVLPVEDERVTSVVIAPLSTEIFDEPSSQQTFAIAAPHTEKVDAEQPATITPAIETTHQTQPAEPPAILVSSTNPDTTTEFGTETDDDRATNPFAPFALVIWATGSIVWFVLALVRIVRFRRVLTRAIPAAPPLQAEVATIAEEIGLRRVPEVLVVPGQLSPLVCTPLRRAVLVLPRDLLARFSAEQRAAVIAHELAHLRRRDHWTRWLEVVCIACYWWLPTVWFARRQLHAAEEACCDAWVVWLLPERSRDYARALLETIDFLTPASDVPLLASGFGRASTLKRRFDMILTQRASHRLSWPARVGVTAASLMILPWSLTTLSADDNPPSATNPTNPPAAPSAGLPLSANNAPTAEPAAGLPSPIAPPSTDAPSADPSVTPLPTAQPRNSNDASPSTTPILPPTAANDPSAIPPGATPALTPTAPQAGAPSSGLPLTPSAAAPSTPPTGFAPPATQPAVAPSGFRPTTTAPRAELTTPASSDAGVMVRLERLEATTAELLILVKQLRAEQQGTTPQPARATGANPWPPLFGLRFGHRDRQLDIEVNGAQIAATDAASQKKLWVASMPFNVRFVQGQQGKLLAVGSDGTTALIDPDSGKIEATNRRSGPNPNHYDTPGETPTVNVPPTPSAKTEPTQKSSINSAARAEQVAKIELDMLAMERKLALERAELQHEVRRMETRRARAARKLDGLPEETASEDRAKLSAELEDAEDQLAAMQHRVDTFEADLEFKIRELQIRRNQMLRTSEPAEKDGSSIDRGNDSTDTVATQDTGLRVEARNVSNPVLMNEELSYFVTVQNSGNQTESDVVVEIELPEGVELPNVQSLHKYERSGGKISFSPIESLRPRAQETFVIRARPTREGKYRLVASVRSGKSSSTQTDQAETTVTEAIRR